MFTFEIKDLFSFDEFTKLLSEHYIRDLMKYSDGQRNCYKIEFNDDYNTLLACSNFIPESDQKVECIDTIEYLGSEIIDLIIWSKLNAHNKILGLKESEYNVYIKNENDRLSIVFRCLSKGNMNATTLFLSNDKDFIDNWVLNTQSKYHHLLRK